MGYFDNDENVQKYIEMAEGVDGRFLVDVLKNHLKENATVLELGMGPGKDLKLLGEHFKVTGSDSSTLFLDRYRQENPDADLMTLDAVTMETERRFDGLYSNKVLIHLTRAKLEESLRQQARVLNPGGLALHSFWYGEGEDEFSGLKFVYYTEESLSQVIGDEYEIVELARYEEAEAGDSLYLILKKRLKP
jgi:SAM-dependent methyltransferase